MAFLDFWFQELAFLNLRPESFGYLGERWSYSNPAPRAVLAINFAVWGNCGPTAILPPEVLALKLWAKNLGSAQAAARAPPGCESLFSKAFLNTLVGH